ncbi:hypothetical protein INQ51_04000 [Maribellus sp. CM-23]|uniref:hypothetical protein n=1 Tax=Maribellus sp. CM-23 TaxID=2781026 RepID=UPI001F305890|nr:hypothetical protein [Maribellus sp. CM-23]MCE4563463.1 hypothetical protein [Maribellus sp. CM-23]
MYISEKDKNEILAFLMATNNNCKNCGFERIEVDEKDLPLNIKQQFSDLGLKGRYLYCHRCKEYSIFSSFEYE